MADAEYRDETVRLEPGDMILTYTDGVAEVMSPAHVLYSEARLRETLAALAGRGVEDTVGDIMLRQSPCGRRAPVRRHRLARRAAKLNERTDAAKALQSLINFRVRL